MFFCRGWLRMGDCFKREASFSSWLSLPLTPAWSIVRNTSFQRVWPTIWTGRRGSTLRRATGIRRSYLSSMSLLWSLRSQFCCLHFVTMRTTALDSIAVTLFSNPNYSETSKLVYTAPLSFEKSVQFLEVPVCLSDHVLCDPLWPHLSFFRSEKILQASLLSSKRAWSSSKLFARSFPIMYFNLKTTKIQSWPKQEWYNTVIERFIDLISVGLLWGTYSDVVNSQ